MQQRLRPFGIPAVMPKMGKRKKKGKKGNKNGEEALRIANPLQEEQFDSDEDEADAPPTPLAKGKKGSRDHGHHVDLHIVDAGKAVGHTVVDIEHGLCNGAIRVEKGVVKGAIMVEKEIMRDVIAVEKEIVKDIIILEKGIVKDVMIGVEYLPDDVKVVGQVAGALVVGGAGLAVDGTKEGLKMGLNAGLALGDALMGRELAKVERTFVRVDFDGSGFIDRDEVKLLMLELGRECTDEHTDKIMAELDPDGDGEITMEEFKDWWVSVGYNASVLGEGVALMKDLGSTPILIFYHMFDENSEWFLTLGEPGIPLRLISDILTWSLNLLQLVWSAAAVLETLPGMSSDPNINSESWRSYEQMWWWVNMVCAFLFMCEWMCRMVGATASGNLCEFMSDRMSYIDLLTNVSGWSMVFEFKTDILGGEPKSLDCRWLRIIRLSRVLKTLRHERINNLAPVVWEILTNSASALLTPVFLLFVMGQVCASLFYYFESPDSITCMLGDGTRVENWEPTLEMNPGCQTEYKCLCAGQTIYMLYNHGTGETLEQMSRAVYSVPDAWWWYMATVTTVGYGDVYPVTMPGQFLGAVTGFLGLLIVAMPIAIVGGSFHRSYTHLEQKLAKSHAENVERLELREKLKKQKKERADQKRKGLLVPKDALKKAMSTDDRLLKMADEFAGDRQDVLVHLKLALDKVSALELKLSGGQPESPGKRSDLGKIVDDMYALRETVVRVWPTAKPQLDPTDLAPNPSSLDLE